MDIAVKEDTSCYASEQQRQVLGLLSRIDDLSREFFLTGGTALSVFYLHHRSSEDVDFFSTTFRDLGSMDEMVRRVFSDDVTLIQSSPDSCSYLIKDVKVDLIFDPLSFDQPRPIAHLQNGKRIFIDTLDNISSNKLSAVVSRYEAKDIVDFYFISERVWRDAKKESFQACYEKARKKEALLDDPSMAAYQMEELLNRVLSEKEKILPPMKSKIPWESFEGTLRFYVELIYRMQEW
jgi:predicted nucleotidyltransferase component of viral defense system